MNDDWYFKPARTMTELKTILKTSDDLKINENPRKQWIELIKPTLVKTLPGLKIKQDNGWDRHDYDTKKELGWNMMMLDKKSDSELSWDPSTNTRDWSYQLTEVQIECSRSMLRRAIIESTDDFELMRLSLEVLREGCVCAWWQKIEGIIKWKKYNPKSRKP